jgi:kynurenine formamidase
MALKFVDISVTLDPAVTADPDIMIPEIEYFTHRETAEELCAFFPGLTRDDLPDGEGWAIEKVHISTHNGTHVDAPWHYHSTMNGGERAIAIDEVPLEWFQQPGVKLDFRHFEDGYVVSPKDIEAELDRIGHDLQPLNIIFFQITTGLHFNNHQRFAAVIF